MSNLLLSLAIGVVLITTINGLLFWFSALGARQTAIVVALATLGIYGPLVILYWPGIDVVAIQVAIYLLSCFGFGLIMNSREQAITGGKTEVKPFYWGPAAIIGFFVVLVIADSIFVTLAERGLSAQLGSKLLPEAQSKGAVSSVFPGVISHDFQKKETFYNEYLLQIERQRARGWQVRKGWLSRPVLGEPTVFQVIAQTPEGDPLPNAAVTGRFLRPSDSRLDKVFTMQEAAPGVYQATLALPAAGMWSLVLQLRKDDDLHEIRANTSVLAN